MRKPKEILPDGLKRCTSCKDIKFATLEFFRVNKNGKNGLEAKCRTCYSASQKAYREREKENIKQKYRDRRVLKPKDQHKRTTRWFVVYGKEPTHKLCRGSCELTKPVIDFSIRGKKKNGQSHYCSNCKACNSLLAKQSIMDNPEKAQKRKEKQKARYEAKAAAKRALKPQPKEGHVFCTGCKVEKSHIIEFFEKTYSGKTGLTLSCRVCVTKEKQKHTKKHLSDKHGYRFCNHCDLELTMNEFKTYSGGFGWVCKACRISSEKTDKQKTIDNARNRLRCFLFTSKERYSDEIGCTNQELRLYIQKQFIYDMIWNNYGVYWNLDHYYPLSKAFDHSQNAYAKARHFTNIKPIRTIDNLEKHDDIPWEYRNIEDFLKDWTPPKSKEAEAKKPFSWND